VIITVTGSGPREQVRGARKLSVPFPRTPAGLSSIAPLHGPQARLPCAVVIPVTGRTWIAMTMGSAASDTSPRDGCMFRNLLSLGPSGARGRPCLER
jgi:hypothetical protein